LHQEISMQDNQTAATRAEVEKKTTRRGMILAIVVALIAVVIGYAMWLTYAPDDVSETARQLREERETMTDEQRRAAVDRLASLPKEEVEQLDDEARRTAERVQQGQQRREQFQAVIDGYFETPIADRETYLDEQIDRFVKMREEWQAERERRRAEREANGGNRPEGERPNRGEERGDRADGERRRGGGGGGGWGGGRGNSADQAKMAEFFSAARKRADERGIDLFGGRGR
jgi:hypothetical protein